MEVNVGCGSAAVSIVDSDSIPVVSFSDVAIIGSPGFCGRSPGRGFGANFIANPGSDFRPYRTYN
jgi:hypothetical protein